MDPRIEIPAYGIFCLLVIKEVLAYLKARKDREPIQDLIESIRLLRTEMSQNITEIHRYSSDLHAWHDVVDPNTGAKVWYFSASRFGESIGSLKVQIERLAEAMLPMSLAIQKLVDTQADIKRILEYLAMRDDRYKRDG